MLNLEIISKSLFVLTVIIIVIAIIAISFIFQYLLRIQKLKPTKLTRIFYEDDESFAISWGKQQQKGVCNYVMKNIIIMTVMNSTCGVIFIFYKSYEYTQVLIIALIMGGIFGLLVSLLGWGRNQDRFSHLKTIS